MSEIIALLVVGYTQIIYFTQTEKSDRTGTANVRQLAEVVASYRREP